MKKTICTILGTLMAASLLAQNNSNSLPAIPAPVSSPAAESAPAPAPQTTTVNTPAATPSPAPVKHKKHHMAKAKSEGKKKYAKAEPSVMLAPGSAEVNATELVVRGQAGMKGEMVGHLYKGDNVVILEEIDLSHHEADEPSQWAKISYPTNGHVYVDAKYIDASGMVKTKKLNLRAGPGENFSVVGVVEQGTQLTPEGAKGNWMRVDPPANAYAFVAAKFLTQEANQQVASSSSTTVAPEGGPGSMSPGYNNGGMNGNGMNGGGMNGGQTPSPTPTQVQEPSPIITQPTPEQEAPPAPAAPSVRVVQHEGVVGPVGSMIAPTAFKLYNPDTKVDIDYLYAVPGTSISNDQLMQLQDDRVVVTGEEGIDQRWPNTPVIAIQSIQVIATNVIKRLDLTQPRQRH
jgi:uncharacterized protein YgiM (DUF1202 family)